jgi:hypothetical protein
VASTASVPMGVPEVINAADFIKKTDGAQLLFI